MRVFGKLPRTTTKTGLIILAGVFLLVFSYLINSGTFSSLKGISTAQISLLTSSQKSEHWGKRFDEIGPSATYLEFKGQLSQEKLAFQHGLSHFMGELLYQKVGLDGFAVCDQEFNYSCYHGFFTAALADKGIPIVKDLNKVCEDKYNPLPSPCQHGIGHGLMSYLGRDRLVEALRFCKLTNQTNPLHGCSSGLFMEYNASSHFAKQDGGIDRRVLNQTNPHEPCNTAVPPEFRPSCYFEIPLWWRDVYNRDFDTMGRLCQVIQNDDEQSSCYQGMGIVIAPTTNYNVSEAISLCKKMPSISGQRQCLSSTFKVFKALPGYQNVVSDICQGLPPTERNLCENN